MSALTQCYTVHMYMCMSINYMYTVAGMSTFEVRQLNPASRLLVCGTTTDREGSMMRERTGALSNLITMHTEIGSGGTTQLNV